MRMLQRLVVSLAFVALVSLGSAPPVGAHATLVRSSPTAGAVLSESPPAIQTWFSEEVAVKGSVMRLYDEADKVIATGGVDLKDRDHESMRISPPLLSPGSYQVRWHAISADDNHVTEDVFRFSIRGASRGPNELSAAFRPSRAPIRLFDFHRSL
jgi:methionine-rich copper-binding protein CopC